MGVGELCFRLLKTGESFMAQNPSACSPSQVHVERPVCPNCQTPMALARIMPGIPGFDLRYFECGQCGQVVKETLAVEPAKPQDDKGSFFEVLKPPNDA